MISAELMYSSCFGFNATVFVNLIPQLDDSVYMLERYFPFYMQCIMYNMNFECEVRISVPLRLLSMSFSFIVISCDKVYIDTYVQRTSEPFFLLSLLLVLLFSCHSHFQSLFSIKPQLVQAHAHFYRSLFFYCP